MIKNKAIKLLLIMFISLVLSDNSAILNTYPGTIVDPNKYEVKLVKDDPLSATCTVHPSVTLNDFVILEDTTGSMGDLINVLKNNFATLYTQLGVQYNNPYYALAHYKDVGDAFPVNPYQKLQDLTVSQSDMQTSINTLFPGGGGDAPEAVWNGIVSVTNDIAFRTNSRRALLVFNDAPGHDGPDPPYKTKLDAIAALNAKNIVPIFFTTDAHFPNTIVDYTNFISLLGRGSVVPITADPSDFVAAIIAALGANLDVITTNIVQTQNYIQSVSPTSVNFNTNAPIVFTVNLLDDGSGSGAPDYDAYIDFLQGWGQCHFNISQVIRNKPPLCGATGTPQLLWPPNHKYVDITIGNVVDPDGDPITIVINSIKQSESTSETGSGSTCPDGKGIGTGTASVRSERSGNLNGRRYAISFTATDGRGGSCQGTREVCVPHDQGNNNSCLSAPVPTIDSTVC